MHSPNMFFVPKKTPKKLQFISHLWQLCSLYSHLEQLWLADQSYPKHDWSYSKCNQSYPIWYSGVTLVGLWFRISSKRLIITYGKGIELNANYHIVFSSWGLCDVAYFQNFQKSSKIDQSYPVSWYPPPTQEYCNIVQYKAYYFIIRLYS